MLNISIVGSGAWGRTLAEVFKKNGHSVSLYSARSADFDGKMLTHADIVLFTCASFAMRDAVTAVRKFILPHTPVVSCAKGIEIATGLRMSQVLAEELGGAERIAVLTGPNHAEEVALEMPTGTVIASANIHTAAFVQDALMNNFFRVYTARDVVGAELCAAFKNVMAIAVGISDGMGFGDNTKAMLMTRGLYEMSLLCEKLGGKRETCSGLAGAGDLFVTCTSKHSRNRRAGLKIGQGMSATDAMAEIGEVVEGYYAAAAAMELQRNYDLEMPICGEIYDILYNGKDHATATFDLMARTKKEEINYR